MNEELYTPEKINEVINWFKEHDAELPKSFQMDAATKIPDLRNTIDCLSQASLAGWEQPTFYPVIKRFYRLRDMVEEYIKNNPAN